MTQRLPIWDRIPDIFLIAALLLLAGGGLGQRLLEHQRGLAAAGQALATVANAAESYVLLNLDMAKRQLDAVAAGAADPQRPGKAELLRLALAGVPDAGFAALLDPRGRALATAGQIDSTTFDAFMTEALARLAGADAPVWYYGGSGTLLVARRVALPGGGFGGIAVLALGPAWMNRFAAGMDLGAKGDILLRDADRRVILRAAPGGGAPGDDALAGSAAPVSNLPASNLPASNLPTSNLPASNLVETRIVVPGQLDLVAERSRADVLGVWWLRSANSLAVLTGVLGMLMAGWYRTRQRALWQHAANRRHLHRLAQLAAASEQLSRLRDVGEIASRAGVIGQMLLGCERVEVKLGPAAEPSHAPAAEPLHSVALLGAGGERLGQISVSGAAGVEETLVLEQFARSVASALEGATLLADTQRAKAELELILSTIADGMLVLDRHWCIRYANAAAARTLHRPHDEMLGADVWTLLPGMRAGDIGERLEAAAEQGHDAAFISFYAPLNAWFELRANPFQGGMTVYLRDVTIQWDTEEKLRQVQKLEAVGQLSGGIAHDVNNLLTVILGNLELLAMRAEDRLAGIPDEEEDPRLDLTLAEAGVRAGDSASQLMHRLLAFSRRQPLAPQVVAVGDLLRSLQPLMRGTITEQVSLQMRWPAGLWHALVDPSELESAIINLSMNAQDAMPGGGSLTIEARNVAADSVYAAGAGLERTGDYIMVMVSDTGTGMPKSVVERAFDPFFTTKAPGKGTGLGLSMVYGFVRQSGGQVLIDSEPGRGTTVRMYLPRVLPPTPAEAVPGRAGLVGGSESILLVEDNDLVRAHTEAMLRGLGYAVAAASDGPSALRLLSDRQPPDLLLTDVILPGGMTGRDVAEAMQEQLPRLRVLFISGYSGDVLMENGRLPAGVDLLCKPFRRSELAVRVREKLDA